MKNGLLALLIAGLLSSACAGLPVPPATPEPPAAPVSPSPTLLTPDGLAPTSIMAGPTATPFSPGSEAPRHKVAISPQNIEQVALLSRLGRGIVKDIAYAPDGKTLAIATTLNVYLTNTQKQTEIASFPTGGGISPYRIAFNRQGDLLVFGEGQEDTCRILVRRFTAGSWEPAGDAGDLSCGNQTFSPDGEYSASFSYDEKRVTAWQVQDPAQRQTFALDFPGDIYSILVPLALSGKGTLAVGEASRVSIYDLQSAALLYRLEAPGMTSVHRLAISQDGQVLAARDSASQTIYLWNLASDASLAIVDDPEDWLSGSPFLLSPDGAYVAFGHIDQESSNPGGRVKLWRTSDGEMLASLASPDWYSSPGMTFTPDGSQLVTWQDGVDFWRASDGALAHSLPEYGRVDGVLSPGGTLLADASGQNIRLYRLSDGQVVQTLEEAEGDFGPQAVVFSPDGSLLVSKRMPGKIQIWGVADGVLKNSLAYDCSEPASRANQVKFSPDGQFLAVYADSRRCRGIAAWRARDGQRLYEFEGSGGDSFSISPDGKILVVEDERAGTISFVRVQDGTVIQAIERPPGSEFSRLLSSFSPDSRLYAIGATDGEIKVWQVGVAAPLYTLTNSFEWTALTFSPDGRHLILGSDTIRMWDASVGVLLRTLEGQPSIWEGRVFSPDGTIMVTAEGGSVQLWSLDDGTRLRTLDAFPLFSPVGRILVTSGEGMIQLWSVNQGTLLRTLEGTTIPIAFSADGSMLIAMWAGVVETWGVPAR